MRVFIGLYAQHGIPQHYTVVDASTMSTAISGVYYLVVNKSQVREMLCNNCSYSILFCFLTGPVALWVVWEYIYEASATIVPIDVVFISSVGPLTTIDAYSFFFIVCFLCFFMGIHAGIERSKCFTNANAFFALVFYPTMNANTATTLADSATECEPIMETKQIWTADSAFCF